MPQQVAATDRFDTAIARLEAISTPSTAHYIRYHKQRCIDDARQIASRFPGARVLNVGGRPYLFEYVAREMGLDVVTLDLDPSRNPDEIADLGITVIAADFETAEGRAAVDLAAFDVICLAEIFEHMRIDLLGTFAHLAQAMRPDALVYLTTPNFYHAPGLLRMLAEGRSGPPLAGEWRKLHTVGHMGHVREYSRRELVEFFAAAGLAVDRHWVRNTRFPAITGGGVAQVPVRLLARLLARYCDAFGEELVFLLRPAGQASG